MRQLASRVLSALAKVFRSSSGVSTAEYALILACVGTAIAVAAIGLGRTFRGDDPPTSNLDANMAMPANASVAAGQGAFAEPPPLVAGTWSQIEFFAGPDLAALADEAEGEVLARNRAIYISPTMKVTLLPDPEVEIRTKSEALQQLGDDRTASWQWDVRPKSGGDRTLIAQVEVFDDSKPAGPPIERYKRRLSVHVEVTGFARGSELISKGKRLSEEFGGLLKAILLILVTGMGILAIFGFKKFKRWLPSGRDGSPDDK